MNAFAPGVRARPWRKRPRPAPLLRSALAAAALAASHAALAARPMVTDDARILDPKACQIETWVRGNPDSTEIWALPACNFTGNLELTLGGAATRAEGHTRTSGILLQGKTLFRAMDASVWRSGSPPASCAARAMMRATGTPTCR